MMRDLMGRGTMRRMKGLGEMKGEEGRREMGQRFGIEKETRLFFFGLVDGVG